MAATELQAALEPELNEAEAKAWDSLGRYKFQMFGYWAAIWVHLNRLGKFNRPNPWRDLVKASRDRGLTANIIYCTLHEHRAKHDHPA